MTFRFSFILIILLFSNLISAQIVEAHGSVRVNGVILPVVYTDQDTFVLAEEDYFSTIVVTAPRYFNSTAEQRLYYKYRRYAADVYPYAKRAIQIFRELEQSTEGLNKRKRKKEVRQLQRDLKDEFTDPLKKLTKTQGRILVNMIEKELDTPLYDLLKEWKGGFSATYWQTVGSFFDYDLKEGYIRDKDPIMDMVLDDYDLSYGYK